MQQGATADNNDPEQGQATPEKNPHEHNVPTAEPVTSPPPTCPTPTIIIDSDNKSECGYTGGVNQFLTSDSEVELSWESSAADVSDFSSITDFDNSDIERLVKGAEKGWSLYEEMQVVKSAGEWQQAEEK